MLDQDSILFSTRGLQKRHGSKDALVDINLDIARGEIIGLVGQNLSLIHISEPTRLLSISYAVFCLKKKKKIKKKKKKNFFFFFLMIRRPPRSTPKPSSAASDVYKRQMEILV